MHTVIPASLIPQEKCSYIPIIFLNLVKFGILSSDSIYMQKMLHINRNCFWNTFHDPCLPTAISVSFILAENTILKHVSPEWLYLKITKQRKHCFLYYCVLIQHCCRDAFTALWHSNECGADHRKHRSSTVVHVHLHGNVFTEPLLSKKLFWV